MFICVSHQLGLLENLKNYAGKFQRKHNYVFKHPTPMNLLQQIYSQLLIQSKRLECCDCTSFWFHLSYDFNKYLNVQSKYAGACTYRFQDSLLVVSDGNIFVLGGIWDNLQETFNLCLVVQRQTESFCKKKQPLELISSSPCSKETNRIFCSHNYSLNSYYCRFWSWIIPLY